jgi:hypothetical protein
MGRIKIDVMRAQQCLEFLFKRRLAMMFFLRSAGGPPASVLAMKIRERLLSRIERSEASAFLLPSSTSSISFTSCASYLSSVLLRKPRPDRGGRK